MSLEELKALIDLAIDDCDRIIQQNPKVVLSEGDFERLLANAISKRIGYVPEQPNPDGFVVHSQISHYENEQNTLDARVDLLLMKPEQIKKCCVHNKRFIYKEKDSFAIEVKYQHAGNNDSVQRAKEDIDKYIKYKEDSWYYAVILLDENDKTSEYEKDILNYFKEKKEKLGEEYKERFFCKVLIKKT